MEDTALHWHHCQGMSLGPYEGDGVFGDGVFGYLLYFFVTCSKKGHYIDVNGILDHFVFV